MTKKELFKFIYHYIIYIIIIVVSIYIHEFGHCWTALLVGAKCSEIVINTERAYVKINDVTNEQCRFLALGGIFFTFLFYLPLHIIAQRKKWYGCYLGTSTVFLYHFFYFGISYYIKFGDGYNFLEYTPEVNPLLFSIFFLFNFVFFCIIFFITFLRMIKFIEI